VRQALFAAGLAGVRRPTPVQAPQRTRPLFANTGIGNPDLLTAINGDLERVIAVLQAPGPPDNPGVFCATAGGSIG
jgi:hypothetical protein